jgi:hypothetical protein
VQHAVAAQDEAAREAGQPALPGRVDAARGAPEMDAARVGGGRGAPARGAQAKAEVDVLAVGE